MMTSMAFVILRHSSLKNKKFFHYLLTLMLFQTRKAFVHFQNSSEDLFDQI